MKPARPAVVYAPNADDQDLQRIEDLMLDQRLYLLDQRVEREADVLLPVVERPLLLLQLMWIVTGKPPLATAFVTDHLSSLGASRAEQLAYVGLLLEADINVYIGCDLQRYGQRQYQQARLALAQDEQVNELQQILVQRSAVSPISAAQAQEWGGDSLLPTQLWGSNRSYPNACWRAKELADLRGLNATQIARWLNLDGYQNKKEHLGSWTVDSVRRARTDARPYADRTPEIEPKRRVFEGRRP